MEKTIGQILIEKLTPDELAILVDAFDDGNINDIFYNELYLEDKKNYPKDYADPESEEDIAKASENTI